MKLTNYTLTALLIIFLVGLLFVGCDDDPTGLEPVNSPDLKLIKSVSFDSEGSPSEGDTIIYELSLSNKGTALATSVTVLDSLPDGVSFARFVSEQGVYSSGDFLWKNITDLEIDATIDLQIICTVNMGTQGQEILNTAKVATVSPADLNIEDNQATAIFTVHQNPPVASDDIYSLDEGAELTVSAEDGLLANDVDPEGDDLTVDSELITQPIHGQVLVSDDGGFVYTHDGSESQSDSFQYQITDVPGLADTATVALVISPVDDAPVAVNDFYSVEESHTISGNLKTNDSDADTDMANVDALLDDPPAHHQGTFTLNPDGSFEYIHDGLGGSLVSFDYYLEDETSSSDMATVTISIFYNCAAPVIASPIPNQTIDEGATFDSFNLDDLVEDQDTSDENITWVLEGAAVDLIVNISADRVLTVTTPDENWHGSETLTFIASDDCPSVLEDEFSTVFTVESVNDVPVQTEISDQSSSEDVSFNPISLDDFVSDIDHLDSEISWSFDSSASPSHLHVIITNDRILNVSSNENWFGQEILTLTSTDAEGATDSQDVVFTLVSVNDNPVVSEIQDQSILEGGSFLTFDLDEFVIEIEDSASDLTWEVSGHTDLIVNIDFNHVVEVIAPNSSWFGEEDLIFTATDLDGGQGSYSVTFTVIAVNDPPVLDSVGNQSTPELALLPLSLSASDPEGDELTFSLDSSSLDIGMTIDSITGDFVWTPAEHHGPGNFTVEVSVSDGSLVDSETFSIAVSEVRQNPVLSPIGNLTANEEETLTFTAMGFDGDLPEQELVYNLDQPSINAGMNINSSTGVFIWTPSEALGGTQENATLFVTDEDGLQDSETFTIDVAEVNSPPNLMAVDDQITDEFSTISLNFIGADDDFPAQGFTYSIDSASLALGMVVNAASGAFEWTPGELHGGQAPFPVMVTLTDDDPNPLTDSFTFNLTVNEINQEPVLGSIGAQSGSENSTISFTVSASDSDLPDQSLTFSLDSASQNMGMSLDAFTGVFNWTPGEMDGGTSPSVTISVADSDGGTDSESFTISVIETNSFPVLASIDDQTITEFSTFSITAQGSDGDHPAQNLTYFLDGASTARGITINSATGQVFWNPGEEDGGAGPFTVTVTVMDSPPGPLGASESFILTVEELNQAPILDAVGNLSVDEGNVLSLDASASDGDLPTQTLTFSLDAASVALGMTINSGSGEFFWIPDGNQGGTAPVVTFTVSDPFGFIDSETITITVNEVN